MDANSAAVRIQQAWRGWQNRAANSGSSVEEDEAAQTTSGYMSASSSAEPLTLSSHPQPPPPPAPMPQAPPPPRRSWTSAALPLNLHRFGDSSGDASPMSSPSLAAPSPPPPPLSVGASRTDLTCLQQQIVSTCRDPWLRTLSADYRSGPDAAMELCYRNDAASDFGELSDMDGESNNCGGGGGCGGGWQRFCRPSLLKNSEGSRSQQISGKSASRSSTRRPLEPELLESLGLDCNHEILSVHTRLRGEAQLALAQAKPMARMQLQIDSSPSDESMAHINFAWPGRLSEKDLLCASRGALRMLRRCLLTRIDASNSELANRLVERDDLHMEQDSLLLEVEDLTRRAKEAAHRLKGKEAAATCTSAGFTRLPRKLFL